MPNQEPKKKPAKQFVAHGRHNRNHSSTRLNTSASRTRIVPLTGMMQQQEGTTNTSGGSDHPEDPRSKMMNRSKSTDQIFLRKDRRITPLKSSRSQTRLNRPSPANSQLEARTSTRAQPRHQSKGIIQLDREDSDTDEDIVEESGGEDAPKKDSSDKNSRPSMTKAGSQDSLSPMYISHKAAPPKINNEIVFATTQDGSSREGSAEVDTDTDTTRDNQSTQKSPMRPSLDRTASATHTTRTQQKLWLQRESVGQQPVTHMSPEQRKEFERISKEYMSVCKYASPMADAVKRITNQRMKKSTVNNNIPKKQNQNQHQKQQSQHQQSSSDLATGLSQSLPKRVNSLSATVLNKSASGGTSMSSSQDSNKWHHTPDGKGTNPMINGTRTSSAATAVDNVSYNLAKLWNEGWTDPSEEPSPSPSSPSYASHHGKQSRHGQHHHSNNQHQPSINQQAQQAQQHMAAARTSRGPNGGIRLG